MILAADYSQLELRVLAHLSKDPRLLQVKPQNTTKKFCCADIAILENEHLHLDTDIDDRMTTILFPHVLLFELHSFASISSKVTNVIKL